MDQPDGANKTKDLAGAPLQDGGLDEKAPIENHAGEKVPIESHNGNSTSDKILTEVDGEQLNPDYPTEEEKRTLRHVGDPLPKSAFLVAIVELCERFTYYGASGIFQNYVQKPLDGSEGRGALGMGHQGATGLTTFFQFWCYGMLHCPMYD